PPGLSCLVAQLLVELLGEALQIFLLRDAGGLAAEVGGEQIGVRRQTAGALDDVTESFPFLNAIHASTLHLALEPYELSPLLDRNSEVILREDRNHIAGYEQQIVF